MSNKISVIITTYNRPYKLVERCINSVLNQTYNNYEIIVVNDTPKKFDTLREVSEGIKKLENEVRYISDGVNRGACKARNIGVEHSNGEYLAFLDDDDEWCENKLEEQLKIIQEKDCVMVTCLQNMLVEDKKRKIQGMNFKLGKESTEITIEKLLLKNIVGGCSAPLICKEIFLKIGGFDNSLPAAQDYDLWIRLAKMGKIYCINRTLLNYHIHKGDRISGDPEKKIYAYKHLLEKYSHISKGDKRFFKNKYLVLSYCYYKKLDVDNGKKFLKLANKQNVITVLAINYYFKIINLMFKTCILKQIKNNGE